MQKYLYPLIGFLIIAGSAGIGLWLAGSNIWGISVAFRSRKWPIATGMVVSSDVCTITSSRGLDEYYPCVTYRFSVNGRNFESDHIYGVDSQFAQTIFYEDAERLSKAYEVGEHVQIFYDPTAPALACLQPGVVPWLTYVAIFVEIGLIGFFPTLLLIGAFQKWRRLA